MPSSGHLRPLAFVVLVSRERHHHPSLQHLARGGGGSGGVGGVCEAMLRPPRRLRTPDRDLVEVVAVCELVGAAVKEVEALAHLGEVGLGEGTLTERRRQRLTMISARAALALEEPFAMEEAAMDQPMINVLLKAADEGYPLKEQRKGGSGVRRIQWSVGWTLSRGQVRG